MRYREFIAEDPTHTKLESFEWVWTECQPFLKAIEYNVNEWVLHRGMQFPGELTQHLPKFGIKEARLGNRTPMDTSAEDHNALNQYFVKNHDKPYRNGVFAAGAINLAAAYGTPMAIFPIGQFDYVWHPNIKDLYSEVVSYEGENIQKWKDFASVITGRELDLGKDSDDDFLYNFLEEHNAADLLEYLVDHEYGSYMEHGLASAIESKNNEIMLWMDKYFYMTPEWLESFNKWVKKHK